MKNIEIVNFVLASIAIILTPGSGSLFVAKSAVLRGMKNGFFSLLGIISGDIVLMFLSFSGISTLFKIYPQSFYMVKFFGACYLIYLGIISLFLKDKDDKKIDKKENSSFLKAIFVTLLNPNAVIFFMSFFPLFIKNSNINLLYTYLNMSIVFTLISIFYLSSLVFISSYFGKKVENSVYFRKINKIAGVIFILFGFKLIFRTN